MSIIDQPTQTETVVAFLVSQQPSDMSEEDWLAFVLYWFGLKRRETVHRLASLERAMNTYHVFDNECPELLDPFKISATRLLQAVNKDLMLAIAAANALREVINPRIPLP